MIITTRFNIGDKVWRVVQTYHICPTCKQAQAMKKGPWKIIGPRTISSLYLMLPEDQPRGPSYFFHEPEAVFDDLAFSTLNPGADLFSSEAEAQAECEKRNREVKAGRIGPWERPE